MSSTDAKLASSNGSDVDMKDPCLGPDGQPAPTTEEEYACIPLTLRAIVSSKEAGVIIGKAGQKVADLRAETGVKAGVSPVVQGVHDRILTITGGCDAITRAYCIVVHALVEGAPAMSMSGSVQYNATHPIKLLISHNQMGTIIGRQGLKIKEIQDESGVRMVAHKDMLPQSNERIVEILGTPECIQAAMWEICKCLVDDWQRGTGTVLYNPVARSGDNGAASSTVPRITRTGHGSDFTQGGPCPANPPDNRPPYVSSTRAGDRPTHGERDEECVTNKVSIPSNMVGCVIGRGGTTISEIRKSSGAQVSIAKGPHDSTGERILTVTGTAEANRTALGNVYDILEVQERKMKSQ